MIQARDWLRDFVVVMFSSKSTNSRGVGMSGKFDQYFPVTDLKKTCCSHDHCEPDYWPLTLFSLKFYPVPSLAPCDCIVVIT